MVVPQPGTIDTVGYVAEIIQTATLPSSSSPESALFLNVCALRMARIVDRSRELEPSLLASRGEEHDRIIGDLRVLDRRIAIVNWAIFFAVLSAGLICAVVVLLFADPFTDTPLGAAIAILFMASMTSIGLVATSSSSPRPGSRRDRRGSGGFAGARARIGADVPSRQGEPPPLPPLQPETGAQRNDPPARVSASHVLDRVLVLEMVRVTEAAAISASKWIGRGDNDAADAAAVEAMRAALNELPFDGTVVIGEGERDEAPMLYIGEKVDRSRTAAPRSTSRSTRSRERRSPPRRAPTRLRCWRSPRTGACSTRRTSTWKSSRSARLSRRHHRPQPLAWRTSEPSPPPRA